jgi:hypothetical protein
MKIKVQALRQGYFGHVRIKEGQKFLMNLSAFLKKEDIKDEEKLKKLQKEKAFVKFSGKEYLPPSWIKVLDSSAKVEEKQIELESQEEVPTLSEEVI